jgi:hypothetical protein
MSAADRPLLPKSLTSPRLHTHAGLLEGSPRVAHVPVLDLQASTTDREREVHQRDQGVYRGLRLVGAQPDDLVLITDVDGVVSAPALEAARRCAHSRALQGDAAAFHLRHHVYNLNWTRGGEAWGGGEGARLVRAGVLLGGGTPHPPPHAESVAGIRGPSALFRGPQRQARSTPFSIFERGAGWHLSWFGHGAADFVERAKAKAGQEVNIFPYLDTVGMPKWRAEGMV